jgi:hypothetical protein
MLGEIWPTFKPSFRTLSGANKLSGVVARHRSGFMKSLGGLDETDGLARGDPEDEI